MFHHGDWSRHTATSNRKLDLLSKLTPSLKILMTSVLFFLLPRVFSRESTDVKRDFLGETFFRSSSPKKVTAPEIKDTFFTRLGFSLDHEAGLYRLLEKAGVRVILLSTNSQTRYSNPELPMGMLGKPTFTLPVHI